MRLTVEKRSPNTEWRNNQVKAVVEREDGEGNGAMGARRGILED